MYQRTITVTIPAKKKAKERETLPKWVDRVFAGAYAAVMLIFLSFTLAAIIHERTEIAPQAAIAVAEISEPTEATANYRQINPEEKTLAVASVFPKEAPTPEPTEQVKTPEPQSRYAEITEIERDLVARMVFLEAGTESAEGQQAVAEVILNRVAADNFPETVQEVLYQGYGTSCPQFSPIARLEGAEAGAEQYAAVDAALYGEAILPLDVVFFSRGAENSRIWGSIGNHVFCYQYIWD